MSEQTLWLDETVHLIQAKNFLRNGSFLANHDNNGVLFTVLLVPVFQLFGTAVENARMISVLFGLGSVALVYLIARRLFSIPVALLALILTTFSPYLIFWSKIARNYSIFLFFVLLATIQIINLTNANREKKGEVSLAKVTLLLLTLIAGFFSHYLMLLFIGGISIWLLVLNKNQILIASRSNFKIVAATFFLLIIAFYFLNENKELVAWATPDWQHLKKVYSETPWYSFSTYSDVLLHDWNYLCLFTLPGLAFIFLRKQFVALSFFLCCLILPFLLLSFVFREPTAARYLIFIYPFFLILAAYGLYETVVLVQQLVKRFYNAQKPAVALVISTFLLLLMLPLKNLQAVTKFSFSDSNKPDSRIIECVFSDWKHTCDDLKNRLKPADIVLATVPQIASVYLDRSDIGPFRQLHLDPQQKKYISNAPDTARKNSAQTTQDLVRTVQNNERGWVLADFYLESVMTDPTARNFIFQQLHFYPEASADGSVLLFGWDKTIPAPQHQNMILQIGRSNQPFSRELTFQVSSEILEKPAIQMRYRTKFAETVGEAALGINGFKFPLAVSDQNADFQSLTIPTTALRRGQNIFRFLYEEHPMQEQFKGYVVYYLEFVP